ncbi:MAG: response regulator transcription factor [Bacillota bacterium]|nr:response regulator transcription factor [Bacillota bacterium]
MINILVLEDEANIRGFIKINLVRNGFEVIEAETGYEALEKAENKSISIAILDIVVPGIDGIAVCRQLRREYPQMGIIMLTARGQERNKIEGLEAGADDYIVKPFSPKELVARVRAVLRRTQLFVQSDYHALVDGSLELLVDERKMLKNKNEINLSPTEFHIVKLLLENVNKSLSREDILDIVWGIDYPGDPKIVDVNIRRIRQKIEDNPSDPEYLHTVWGYGYRWGKEE